MDFDAVTHMSAVAVSLIAAGAFLFGAVSTFVMLATCSRIRESFNVRNFKASLSPTYYR